MSNIVPVGNVPNEINRVILMCVFLYSKYSEIFTDFEEAMHYS